MSIVLDASLTLTWFLEEDGTEAAVEVARMLADRTAIVPQLWALEVANGFQMAIRKRRTTAASRDVALRDLSQLVIETDPETGGRAWHATLELSDRYDLTAYDAAYLELAIRRRVPLATLDRKLAAAARSAGVAVLP